ncbi:MAG: CRTAC1 family protein [Planctomycetaceae bacterium]
MGGGCAFFDADGDGDQDLLCVGGRRWPWDDASPSGGASTVSSSLALYLNDGTGGFTNATAGSGLEANFYGQGVAVGDYDGDGRSDVYVSAVGPNHLYHNLGEGRFEEVTASAGVAGGETDWGTSCGWLDYDRDGDLDLYVCNYVAWSREHDEAQNFQLTGGGRAYGRPQNFEGTFPLLFRNDGNGTFSDVTKPAGLQTRNPATDVPMAKGLGVTFADFNADGWLDILMANDTVQNFLYLNQQDGTFREVGALAGIAFDMNGNARGAMGIDAAYFRNDESLGVAIGNFANEMTALYVTRGDQLVFSDEAISNGLGPNSRLQLTFGLLYLDADLDGRLDICAANGHLEEEIHRVQPSQFYEQAPQLFWNCGPEFATEFVSLASTELGDSFLKPLVGRGSAFADIDADGDLDVVLMNCGGRPRLLRNEQQLGHHWLRVRLQGANTIGAMVEVDVDGRTLRRSIMPTRSYLSQSEAVATFGLGDSTTIPSVRVIWPDGRTQRVPSPPLNETLVVKADAKDASAH